MSDFKLVTAVDAENPVVHDIEIRNGQIVWVGLDAYDAEDQAAMIPIVRRHQSNCSFGDKHGFHCSMIYGNKNWDSP